MKLIGYIVRRRCIGRNLAFADIQLVEPASLDMASASVLFATLHPQFVDQLPLRLIQVVFRRDGPEWNQEWDETFPHKNAKLPYGGKVTVEIFPDDGRAGATTSSKNGGDDDSSQRRPPSFLVHRWELLEHPRDRALEEAQSSTSDGISCSTYLKSRGNAFLRFNDNAVRSQPKRPLSSNQKAEASSSNNNDDSERFSHGDNRAKALRATIFASWLLETFGQDYLQSNGGVLDIAGGKGKLSIELALQGKIPCTIVDPLVRKHGAKLEPRDARRILKAGAPHPQLVAKFFNTTTFLQDNCQELLDKAQLCVGLHPDECTEDIVNVALEYDKPLAIVPCCVFTGLFPGRTVRDASTNEFVPVRTYEQFLDYLLAKDERLQTSNLPFEGRNVVIYCLPSSPSPSSSERRTA